MPRTADYDTVASRYDRRYEEYRYEGIEQALLAFVSGTEVLDVLEVGCGTGHWLGLLGTQAHRLAGIDPSAAMLGCARQASHDANLVRGRAEELPWATGNFDRVFCVNAFHHFAGKARFLTEAHRVLRSKGGVMIIGLDPHTGQERWWVYGYFLGVLALDKERYPPSAEIRAAMAEAGFTRSETREAQRIVRQVFAHDAIERNLLDRSVTSQLMILSEQEYQDGFHRIRSAMEAASAMGEELALATDLRLYATIGWME